MTNLSEKIKKKKHPIVKFTRHLRDTIFSVLIQSTYLKPFRRGSEGCSWGSRGYGSGGSCIVSTTVWRMQILDNKGKKDKNTCVKRRLHIAHFLNTPPPRIYLRMLLWARLMLLFLFLLLLHLLLLLLLLSWRHFSRNGKVPRLLDRGQLPPSRKKNSLKPFNIND